MIRVERESKVVPAYRVAEVAVTGGDLVDVVKATEELHPESKVRRSLSLAATVDLKHPGEVTLIQSRMRVGRFSFPISRQVRLRPRSFGTLAKLSVCQAA